MYYIVTKYDLEHLHNGLISNQVNIIWRDMLKKLPEKLQNKLEDSKFDMTELKGLRTKYDKTFVLTVPNAPKKFNDISTRFENHILCFDE